MADVDDLWFEDDPGNPGKQRPTPKHGNGLRYQARWRDPAGAQRKKNFATKRDANAHLAKMTTDKQTGSYIDPKAGQILFMDFAETWRAGRTHDVSTATRIESEFRLHVYEDQKNRKGRTPGGGPSIGQYQAAVLANSPSIIQAWIKGIPLAASTAELILKDVNQVFVALIDDSRISKNPLTAKSIQKPRPDRHETVVLSLEESAAVTAELADREQAMASLSEACGHRQGEAFAAAAGDIDFLRKMVTVSVQVKYVAGEHYFAPVKNRRRNTARTVPASDPFLFIMSEHMRRFPPVAVTLKWWDPADPKRHLKPVTRRLLFTRPGGFPFTRASFNPHWRRSLKKAGLPYGDRTHGFHILRHCFASRLLSASVGLAKVAAMLGDTQKVVLATYSHFLPSDDDRVREVTAGFFENRNPAGNSAPETAGALDVPSEEGIPPELRGGVAV